MASAIERWYIVIALTILNAEAFIRQAQGRNFMSVEEMGILSEDGDVRKQGMLLAVYAISGLLLVWHVRPTSARRLGTPLILLSVGCLASAAWADQPDLAFRRAIAIVGTVIVGLHAGLRIDIKDMLRLLTQVSAILLISSFIVAVVMPLSGIDEEGRLRGVFGHKNYLGGYAVFAILAICSQFLELKNRSRKSKLFDGLLIVLAFLALALSHSASPIPTLIIGLLVLWLAHQIKTCGGGLLAFVPAIIVFMFLLTPAILSQLDQAAALLDRDAGLSGRAVIWTFAEQGIADRPWFGYGYGTFWFGENSHGSEFLYLYHFAVDHAHNGFIQLTLDAGLFGVTLLMAGVFLCLFRAVLLLRNTQQPGLAWAVGFVALDLFASLSESRLWVPNDVFVIFLVYVVVRVNVLTRQMRFSAYRPGHLRKSLQPLQVADSDLVSVTGST